MANDLSAFNAQAWSKRLVTKLDQINVMLSLINKDYEGELQNIGDTIQIRTPGNITMATYTKGQAISYQDLAPTKEPRSTSTTSTGRRPTSTRWTCTPSARWCRCPTPSTR
jgi:hypothetical protein